MLNNNKNIYIYTNFCYLPTEILDLKFTKANPLARSQPTCNAIYSRCMAYALCYGYPFIIPIVAFLHQECEHQHQWVAVQCSSVAIGWVMDTFAYLQYTICDKYKRNAFIQGSIPNNLCKYSIGSHRNHNKAVFCTEKNQERKFQNLNVQFLQVYCELIGYNKFQT